MSRQRTASFIDGIMVIIMTILVLDLDEPSHISWSGIWALRTSYFSYTLSFFWLGTMWIGLNYEWEHIQKVSTGTVWATLFMLFWISFFPYTTKIMSEHFFNVTAQVMYGIVAGFSTLFNIIMTELLLRSKANRSFKSQLVFRQWGLVVDLVIKLISILIALTVYPPAVAYAVLISAVLVEAPIRSVEVRRGIKLKRQRYKR